MLIKSKWLSLVIVGCVSFTALPAQRSLAQDPITAESEAIVPERLNDDVVPYIRNNSYARGSLVSREMIKKQSRVDRARRMDEARTELQIFWLRTGYDPARPTVNSLYMFTAPPRLSYRPLDRFQPTFYIDSYR